MRTLKLWNFWWKILDFWCLFVTKTVYLDPRSGFCIWSDFYRFGYKKASIFEYYIKNGKFGSSAFYKRAQNVSTTFRSIFMVSTTQVVMEQKSLKNAKKCKKLIWRRFQFTVKIDLDIVITFQTRFWKAEDPYFSVFKFFDIFMLFCNLNGILEKSA